MQEQAGAAFAILESISDAFYALNTQWEFTYVNSQAEYVLGHSRAELLGRSIWAVYPGALGSEFERRYRRAMLEQGPEEFTAFYPDHDRWYEVHVYPAQIGISVYFRNVTQQIRTQNALADKVARLEQSERHQAFHIAMADRLRDLDAPDDITAAACALLGQELQAARVTFSDVDLASGALAARRGWSRDGLPGQGAARLADIGPQMLAQLRAGVTMPVTQVAADTLGDARRSAYADAGIEAELAIPLVEAGQLVAILSVQQTEATAWQARDIELAQTLAERTWLVLRNALAQAALKAERQQIEEQLREADRRKDEFLAMLAHELRNPLAPISAAADVLRITSDPARVRLTSEIITRQVRHMTRLVDDLLDVSRVTRGLVVLEQHLVDMAHVVAEALEQVQPLVDARRHHVTIDAGAGAALVRGDHKRLVQVLANLLSNAAKFTPEGGSISVRIEARGEHVDLSVADDGIGMAAGLSERAFELFSQAERTVDRAQGGLGIGLALVKSLVELHGGQVSVHSEGIGRGSCFQIRLPGAAPARADAAPADAPAGARAPGSLRLMLVDDNQDAADMLGMLLEADGHQVSVEYGSLAALGRAAREAPDVCLLDIGLPDMDGIELAGKLRELPQLAGAVLIAITGYGQNSDRLNTAQAGFAHHFVKPVDTAALSAVLAQLAAAPGQRGG